jgi:preprotein translocase subunit SecA
MSRTQLGDAIFDSLRDRYAAKEEVIGVDAMRYHERVIMLSVLDGLWKDHLLAMDHLKEGIGLRGYGQQDPLVAYKRESFDMFEAMMNRFQEDTVRYLFLMQIVGPDGQPVVIPSKPRGLAGGTLMDALDTAGSGMLSSPADAPMAQTGPALVPRQAGQNGAPSPASRRPTIPGGAASRPTSFVPARSSPAKAAPAPAPGPPTTAKKMEQRFFQDKQREMRQAREEGGSDKT